MTVYRNARGDVIRDGQLDIEATLLVKGTTPSLFAIPIPVKVEEKRVISIEVNKPKHRRNRFLIREA